MMWRVNALLTWWYDEKSICDAGVVVVVAMVVGVAEVMKRL